jgi:hypothetical protein
MFRNVFPATTAPIVRYAFVLGLASALLFCWLSARQGLAAPQTVTRDAQALTLIASALKALTGGVAVNDVIVQASAN